MLRLASFVMIAAPLAGCVVHSAHVQTLPVTNGVAVVRPAADAAPPSAQIELGAGSYTMQLYFTTPRAQVVDWTLACPGTEQQGHVGQSADEYREKELARLNSDARAEWQQRKNAIETANAAVTTSARVVGVAPVVRLGPASLAVSTAPVVVQTQMHVAPVVLAPPVEITELPPGDMGGAPFYDTVSFATDAPGTCVLAIAGDADVLSRFEVTQQIDLDVEAAKRKIAANNQAVSVRGQLVANLSTQGADPDAVAKREEAARVAREHQAAEQERITAEAQAKHEAELVVTREQDAKLRAEREALEDKQRAAADAEDARVRVEYEERIERERKLRIELEMHLRVSVESTHRLLVGYLVGIGADAGHYAREQERIRIEMEMRLRIQMEENERREAHLRIEQDARDRREMEANRQRWAREALIAQQDQHAIEVAMTIRASLRARLLELGARERPEMPAPRPENHGTAPFDGAVWVAGSWTFSDASWSWSWKQGGWGDTSSFGDSGTAGGDVRAPSYVETSVEEPAPVVETAVVTPVVVRPAVVVEAPVVRTPTVTISVPTPSITIHTHTSVRPERPKHEAPPRSSPSRTVIRDHRK
ncbi:MAG TPA: hypothetical protein VGM90_13315 [Kofleriaceae bacterium]|jgi:hypothetical protein